MTIKFGAFELNITAKYIFSKRANKNDLISILNELSIVYMDAAKYNEAMSTYATAADYKKKSDQLYNICKVMGAYKGL